MPENLNQEGVVKKNEWDRLEEKYPLTLLEIVGVVIIVTIMLGVPMIRAGNFDLPLKWVYCHTHQCVR